MAKGAASILRTPMMLLAAGGVAILGAYFWPWAEIANLPGKGTVAYDPALILFAYLGLVPWISSGIKESTQRALSAGAMLGALAGLALVANVLLPVIQASQPAYLQPALLGLAAILWGIAGLRGARTSGNAAMGALSGMWGALLSGLMASTAVLAKLYFAGPARESPDPWKQYEGLAIGNAATQGLVHTLNTATAFLLICPIAGAAAGVIFAFFGEDRKS